MAFEGIAAAADLPLFAGLDPGLRERLLADATDSHAPAGTVLFREGERAEFIHLLIGGVVEISKMDGARECGVLIFTRGDIFMPAATLWDEPYLTSGRALTPAHLVLLRGATVRAEARRSPELAMSICRLVSGQWRMAVRHILDLKCRSAPERLGAFLLRMVDDGPSTTMAELPFPKRSLAARVGMTAETLSRALQHLADQGLHLRGTRILVKDRARIERFCGPDPYPDRAETRWASTRFDRRRRIDLDQFLHRALAGRVIWTAAASTVGAATVASRHPSTPGHGYVATVERLEIDMKYAFTAAAIAATLALGAPAVAQNNARWNSDTFWRSAPADVWQRLGYLQQRIDNGRRDGSLTPAEARRAQFQVRRLRRQAMNMRRRDRGRLNRADSAWLQTRLDTISRNLRWARHNGVGYGDNGPDNRFATTYDAHRYYREGPQYRERRLATSDEVYRGSDGRYYCKRSDGTTGLIVGGAAGGLLGNVIDTGHNRLAGTLIGGALGALAGKSIDQNRNVRCR